MNTGVNRCVYFTIVTELGGKATIMCPKNQWWAVRQYRWKVRQSVTDGLPFC